MLCRVRALILAGWQKLPTWWEAIEEAWTSINTHQLWGSPWPPWGHVKGGLKGNQASYHCLLAMTDTHCLLAQMVKHLPAIQETQIQSLGKGDPLNKGMTTHSSILAWIVPLTVEPGRLQSTGSQRVGHDWVTNPHILACQMRPWGEAKQ